MKVLKLRYYNVSDYFYDSLHTILYHQSQVFICYNFNHDSLNTVKFTRLSIQQFYRIAEFMRHLKVEN